MKTIKMLPAFFLLLLLPANVNAKEINKNVQGNWNVHVAGAPYGYQDYTVSIHKMKDTYVADISGSQLNIKKQELKIEDGKLITTVYAGENVKVVIWTEKDQVKGTADTSMGKLPVTFTRSVKEKPTR